MTCERHIRAELRSHFLKMRSEDIEIWRLMFPTVEVSLGSSKVTRGCPGIEDSSMWISNETIFGYRKLAIGLVGPRKEFYEDIIVLGIG